MTYTLIITAIILSIYLLLLIIFIYFYFLLHYLCVSGVAWVIIPLTFKIENEYFLFKSWNLFVIICSLPSIILTCLLTKLPESPKFLLTQGKHDEALDCLRFIYRLNNKSDEKFPVSTNEL